MNEQALRHLPLSNDSFAYGKDELRLRLRTAKGDIVSAEVIFAVKYYFTTERHSVEMVKSFTDGLYDYYTGTIRSADTRLAYLFRLTDAEGKAYYYSENGVETEYDFDLGHFSFFQFPYINDADLHKKPDWTDDAIMYEIFVDRFRNGRGEAGKQINMKWNEIPHAKSFAGGDLNGITEKLDYIKDLGCNCIYLTPVFTSKSNHKYDISDYYNVDKAFGGNAALRNLIEKAHAKGIRILLDAVFNHCSDEAKAFQDVKRKGKKSKYFDWFIIRGDEPRVDPLNYECFGSCEYMPKLNTSNREVQKYLIEIGKFWIRKYHIDGWRLDVSDEVSHAFWREFRREIKALDSNAVLVGENWHNAEPWLRGDEYDSIMNYSFTKACIDYIADGRFDAQRFAERLSEILMRNTDQVNEMMMNLLDSHDTHRFINLVGGDIKKLKAAIAVTVMFPGIPCLYYGTEIGLIGGYDPDNRRCFNWDESTWNREVYDETRRLLAMRGRAHFTDIRLGSENGVFLLWRGMRDGGQKLLCVNMTNKARKTAFGEIDAYSYDIKDI